MIPHLHVKGAALKKIILSLGLMLCAANLVWAADQAAPAAKDPIGDAFAKAANTDKKPADAKPTAPATDAAPAPDSNAAADSANLPALPTDKESLKALTDALAADKSAMTEQDRRNKAFDSALSGLFPLTPEQIKEVMRRMSEAQEAGRSPPAPEPKPTVKVENVMLDPGNAPPLIAVSSGYVTTVNMLDVTGQPWPIQDVVVGGNFTITGPNDAHVLRIIPQTRFGKGNLSVRLVGLSTPVTFRVEAGGPEVYYRYDARIPQSGPGAKQPLIDHGFTGQAGDPTLMRVLEGVPPTEARKMTITGVDGRTRAYKINDQIYLRTPLTLLSPGWNASVRSADGTNVYVMSDTPVMMLSDNGQTIRAKLTAPPEDPFHSNELKDGKVTVPVNADGSVATPATPQPAAINTVIPSTQPVAGQAALNAATEPPMGGSIANEAQQRRAVNGNNGGVKIYPGNNFSNYNGGGS